MTRVACLITVDEPAPPTLLPVALAHSPRVEDAGAGRVYLDATGLHGLFGDEPHLAARLRAAAAAAGVEIRVGIAKRIAALAAAAWAGVMIVRPGGDAAYLAQRRSRCSAAGGDGHAPVAMGLARSASWRAATARLFERLGGDGVRLQRLAREDPRPLVVAAVPLFESRRASGARDARAGGGAPARAGQRLRASARPGSRPTVSQWTCRLGAARHEARSPRGAHHRCRVGGGLLRLALEARPPRSVVEALVSRARCGSRRRRSRSPIARARRRACSPLP
jgi:hypothetical protein